MVITKNKEGHKRRNTKTALMYSIALAFLIFAGTGFRLQAMVIEDMVILSVGADFRII